MQQYSAESDAAAARQLLLYEVLRPTPENQCSCAMPVKQSAKQIPAQKQTAFRVAFASKVTQIRKNPNVVSEPHYRIKALAHMSKHCHPSNIISAPVLPMLPFRADGHPNGSKGGTMADSGRSIFQIEPENKVNVLILKGSIYM